MIETKMKPILFNTEMAKAILDGRKTQFMEAVETASHIKLSSFEKFVDRDLIADRWYDNCAIFTRDDNGNISIPSKYKINDILYIKEPYYILGCWAFSQICDSEDHESTGENCFSTVAYEDDIDTYDLAYPVYEYVLESADTMEKEMARIFLKVTNVRVERLQDISLKDILKEGITRPTKTLEQVKKDGCQINMNIPRFINLWNSTAKDGYKYEDNPYVFVYEFERVQI